MLKLVTSDISAIRRGQIVQRVLVDRWSPAEAGAAFGLEERHVARLVAAYRRHGMASLRRESLVRRFAQLLSTLALSATVVERGALRQQRRDG